MTTQRGAGGGGRGVGRELGPPFLLSQHLLCVIKFQGLQKFLNRLH